MKAGMRLAAAVATLAISPVALAQHTNVAEAGGPYTWVQGSAITLTNTGHSSDVFAQPGWDLDLDGLGGFTVDRTTLNVLAVPVPEPHSYALLVAGLGLLGFAARRKKQRRTPVSA